MSSSQDKSVPEDRPGPGDRRRLVEATKPGVFKGINGYGKVVGYFAVICPAKKRKRTLGRYSHLLPGDEAPALDLARWLLLLGVGAGETGASSVA